MSWAAVSYLAHKVFSGPSFEDVAIQSTLFLYFNGREGCVTTERKVYEKSQLFQSECHH